MYQGESSWGTGQQRKKKGEKRMQNYNDFLKENKGEERQHKKNRV